MLTRDRGWFKPLLVMSAANLVPIAGELGNKGYGLEWARLTAWGVDSAPKQKGVDVGKCIGSGWRGFVVDLVWGLAYFLVIMLVSIVANALPSALGALIASLLGFATMLVAVAWSVVVMVAEVRAAIYQSIGAGLRFGSVFEMIKRDGSGFIKVLLIDLVGSIVLMMGMFVATIIFCIMFMPVYIQLVAGDASAYAAAATLATAVAMAMPLLIIVGYAISFVAIGLRLLVVNAIGLWMRQFNVPAWGKSEDPLPSNDEWAQQGSVAPEPESHYEPEADYVLEPEPELVPAPAPVPQADEEPTWEPESAQTAELDYVPEPEPAETAVLETEPALAPVPVPVAEPEPQPDVDPIASNEDAPAVTQVLSAAEPYEESVDATTELPTPNDVQEVPEFFANTEPANTNDGQEHVEELYQEFLDVVKDNDLTDDE